MIGGRYAAQTEVANMRGSEHRYRRFEDARARADRMDGTVWDHVEQREIWESPGAAAIRSGRRNPRSY